MSTELERRVQALESAVDELTQAAADERARRRRSRILVWVLFLFVVAAYAYYFKVVVGGVMS